MPSRDLSPGAAILAVLPHRLAIGDPGQANGLPGILSKATFVGRHFECQIDTELGEVFAIVRLEDLTKSVGSDVSVLLAENGPVLVPQD